MSNTTVFEPVELPSRYAKAIVATLTAVLAVIAAALTDDVVTSPELANVGLAILTAIGVYWVPNAPAGAARYLKAIVAVLGTALQALIPYLVEGTITTSGWLMVLLAGLGALAVGIVPNTDPLLPALVEPAVDGGGVYQVPRHVEAPDEMGG